MPNVPRLDLRYPVICRRRVRINERSQNSVPIQSILSLFLWSQRPAIRKDSIGDQLYIRSEITMASAAIQAQANALNAKMEGEASKMLDDVERSWMRKVARQSFACAVKCYDKAGTSGPAESLESCTRNCQAPYQQSSNLVQQVSTNQQHRQVVLTDCTARNFH